MDLVENVSDCDDTCVMRAWLKNRPATIDIGAAGTAMRFSTALLSVSEGTHIITGSARMKQRPIGVLVDALRQLGALVEYVEKEGYPPLRIVGNPRLAGGEVQLSGSVSSQYLSALLMIGPNLAKGLKLVSSDKMISRPYIDMTLSVMRHFGAKASWVDERTIVVEPVPYQQKSYRVENDWSAASYWYEMVALSPDKEAEVKLTGLMDGSKQGDSTVRYIFSLLGVRTQFESKTTGKPTTVTLRKSGHCVPRLEYDFVNSPDLAQTFVVVCALMGVPFRFTGLQTLKIKETDRIEALKKEMLKLGYVLHDADGQELAWEGERLELQSSLPAIDTYEDHRMALAFAPAAFVHPVVINHPGVVSKSYPHFWDDLEHAGFLIDKEI